MKVADIRSNLGFLRAQLQERHMPVLYMEITKIRILLQLCCYEQFGDVQIAMSKGMLLSGWAVP